MPDKVLRRSPETHWVPSKMIRPRSILRGRYRSMTSTRNRWPEFPQSRPATGLTWEDGWRALRARLLAGSSHRSRSTAPRTESAPAPPDSSERGRWLPPGVAFLRTSLAMKTRIWALALTAMVALPLAISAPGCSILLPVHSWSVRHRFPPGLRVPGEQMARIVQGAQVVVVLARGD